MRARLAIGAVGVVVALYGALLFLTRQDPGQWLEVAIWFGVGVVAHDVVLSALVIGVCLVGARLLPAAWRAPATIALVVWGTLTIATIPMLDPRRRPRRQRHAARSPLCRDVVDDQCHRGPARGRGRVPPLAPTPGEGVSPVAKVLVVDDDPTVREVVVDYLRAAGHEVRQATDGPGALAAVREERADLVVLDVMMPGLDGLEVCRRLRVTSDVPIVLLTALGSEQDRVVGLEIGADDYVTKPFSPRELVLRVDSILRRSSTTADTDAPSVLTDGDLVVDRARRLVTKDGQEAALTTREFDLLAFLVSRPGIAFSRDDLLQQVWGWSFGDQSTVTVHVRRLREKVEPDPTNPVRLLTVWGVGYRWEAAVMSDLTEIWAVAIASGVAVGLLGLAGGLGPAPPVAALAARRGRRRQHPHRPGRRAGHLAPDARSPTTTAPSSSSSRAPPPWSRSSSRWCSRPRWCGGRSRCARRYAVSARAAARWPSAAAPRSSRTSPPSWPTPTGGWPRHASASSGSRSRAASSSRGCPTTSARRSPGSG